MPRRVLITGASGFIGKSLAKALAKEGWEVRAASRDPAAIPALAGVERVAMPDLAQAADWSGLLDGVSHVVHLAGIAHGPGSLPGALYSRINGEAVGELGAQARGKVERLVFISSVRAQVGVAAEHIITEKDPALPTDDYGRAKLRGEKLLAQSGVPFTVLRPAVVYGKGVKGNIAALATLAKTPMPLPFARLTNRRSLLALENLASASDARAHRGGGRERDISCGRCRADQRRRHRRVDARRPWAPAAPGHRAVRRHHAADEVVRQGGRLGAHLLELRDRCFEARRAGLACGGHDKPGSCAHDALGEWRGSLGRHQLIVEVDGLAADRLG